MYAKDISTNISFENIQRILRGWYDFVLMYCSCGILAEMKIKREHVQGSADGDIKPEVELITEDTVKKMENPGKVEVCKSSGKK